MNTLSDALVCRMGKIFILFGVLGGRVERVLISQHILAAAGRTSVDRSSKATLLLTVPGGAFKSSAKDLPDRRLKLRLQKYAPGPKPIRSRVTTVRIDGAPSSTASGLEAFSHQQDRRSFASPAFQPNALPNVRTGGSSRTEPDCSWGAANGRVKLTCLTTV